MQLTLSRQQHQQLLDWAEQAGDYECCGLLLGKKGMVERLELTMNVADSPKSNFEIDPSALILAEKQARQGGPEILGYFHSHPNGVAQPSITDAEMAAADGRRWLIIANGGITAWRPIGSGQGEAVVFGLEGFVQG